MSILTKTRTATTDATAPLPLIAILEPLRCEGCGQPITHIGRGKHRPSRVRTR